MSGVAGLNETPRGERLHIGFFGRTNAGKSTLINALTGQEISVVSPVAGTTTDPVYKAMELLPLGPVVLIDTAGLDDTTQLASLRSRKTAEVMSKTDIAILVIPSNGGDLAEEKRYLDQLQAKKIPVICAVNDFGGSQQPDLAALGLTAVVVNAAQGQGMELLRERIIQLARTQEQEISLTQGLIDPGGWALLVTPQDIQAPKGRLILPQVQMIRDLLDKDCLVQVVKTQQLAAALDNLKQPPDLIITDSQVFGEVYRLVGDTIPLTSFSVLLSRAKGDIDTLVAGAEAIGRLQPGDQVLIAEACSHHPLEGDIAREKLPALLEKRVGGPLKFSHCSGHGFPEDVDKYQLIIHCGACMINRKNMLTRLSQAQAAGVPITNFGVALAYLNGILPKIRY